MINFLIMIAVCSFAVWVSKDDDEPPKGGGLNRIDVGII